MGSHKRRRDEEHDRNDDDYDRGHRSEKKEKHRHKKHDQKAEESDDESGAAGRYGKAKLTEDDYFAKSTEFQTWLRVEKRTYFNDLSGDEARSHFKKFVKRWNKGKLDKKYYEGIASSEIAAAERTRHKWNFKNLNEDDLVNARDSAYSLTQSANQFGRPLTREEQKVKASSESRSKSRLERDDELDEAEQERQARRREQRNVRKHNDMVMEELVPKATGREAQLEKKRAQTAYHRQERDVDVELDDRDLMGGGSSIDAYKRAQERRYERRQERREEKNHDMAGKVAAYRAKEYATLSMFKQMAQNRFGSGTG